MSPVMSRGELQPASRTQWAEAQLRSTIVSGELAPGARVRVEELAAKWDVSSTPLREAIRSLAGEGLITLSPQRGARVSEVSHGEMEDVYATRLMLEPYVLRLSLERGGDQWIAELERAWNELDRAQSRNPATPLDLEPAHTAFHRALLSACGPAEAHREHAALYAAAIAFREDEAMGLVAVHLGRTVLSTLGEDALARLIERIRLARGISKPVLDALRQLA